MTDREAMKMALEALENLTTYAYRPSNIFRYYYPSATGNYVVLLEFREKSTPAIEALRQALAQPEQEPVVTDKDGSPCPEFWDWLPKAYNFEGNGTFTKYNMEVAFLAGKNTALAQPKHPMRSGQKLLRS